MMDSSVNVRWMGCFLLDLNLMCFVYALIAWASWELVESRQFLRNRKIRHAWCNCRRQDEFHRTV